MRRNKWLIFCLLVLQGLALAISLDARARITAEHGAALSAAVHCNEQPQGDGGAPAQERHSHSQCCISCLSNLLGDVHRLVPIPSEAPTFPDLEAAIGSIDRPYGDRDGRPTGWPSSWSSRAPPSFS